MAKATKTANIDDLLSTKSDVRKPIYISVKISNDKEIQALNKLHLGRDFPTDVLSFNANENEEEGYFLGDIIVNYDQAKRQASKYKNSKKEEIAQLVEHGVLHLLGVHHKDDDENGVHGVNTKG